MSKPLRVLIVEDSEADAKLLLRELRRGGFDPTHERVETAETMAAALDRQAWDIVISDYRMPRFCGLAALKLFRERELDVPFILVSGTIGEETAVAALKAGANDYVLKDSLARLVPAVERELRDAVERRERKRAEEVLHESEARYRAVTQSANDAMITANGAGIIVGWNRSAEKMFGYPEAEVLGQPLTLVIPPRLRDRHLAGIKRVQAGGERHVIGKTVELAGLRKDGSEFPLELSLSSWKIPEGRFFTGIIRDITERQRAAESHARLATAVEQVAETIMITDVDGKILYVNPAFEKTTGYTRQEATGQNPRILKSGKHDAEFYRRMWAVLTRGEVWSGRFINKRKDGTLFEEETTISPVSDATGRIVNYVAVRRDVTREVQLESQLRQAQKMEAMGRLAGGVAHDFNNILMPIIGYSEMLLKKLPDDGPLRHYADEINQAGERAKGLTRQLLIFSRKEVLQLQVLNPNNVITGVTKMLRRIIGEDIHLTATLDPAVDKIKADPGQIEQVLMNLAVNARDAMPDGGKITIETANVMLTEDALRGHVNVAPGRYVMLAVSDTGTGMDKETQAHLFEAFFTTKPQGQGTGLGLFTSYGIVKQCGGHIGVYSEIGHGTTFKIYLPAVDQATAARAVKPAKGVVRGGTETVLLVEDEEQVRKLARESLEWHGYTVLEASDGEAALHVVREYRGTIHVLLTDMVMPGMNGRVVAQLVVSARPQIKVIYMSGYTDAGVTQQGLLAEGAAFMQKPFTPDALARKIREVLDEGRNG